MSIHYIKEKHSDVVNETIDIYQVFKIDKETGDECEVPIDSVGDNIIDWIVDAYRKDHDNIWRNDDIVGLVDNDTGKRDLDAYAFVARCDCKGDERHYHLVLFNIHVDGSGRCSGFLPNSEAGVPTE